MVNYLTYEVEDFIVDDFFIAWVLDEDPQARHFWEVWLEEHPHKKGVVMQAYTILKGLYIKPEGYLSDAEIEEIHDKVRERITDARNNSGFRFLLMRSRFWLSAAALILVVLTAGIIVYLKRDTSGSVVTAGNQKPVPLVRENKGQKPVLVYLPDRSSVVLKPGGVLEYPSVFTGKSRDIRLTGDAFFEVTTDSKRPFIVHAGEVAVKVLGTAFSVSSAGRDRSIKVVVNSGKVAVFDNVKQSAGKKEQYHPVTLTANEEAVINKKDTEIVKQKLAKPLILSPEVARKMFRFHNASFADVIAKLKEVYGVEILFDEETMGSCPISATLSTQPLYEKVKIICEAVNAGFTITDTNITIEGKGCTQSPDHN